MPNTSYFSHAGKKSEFITKKTDNYTFFYFILFFYSLKDYCMEYVSSPEIRNWKPGLLLRLLLDVLLNVDKHPEVAIQSC